MTTLFRQPRETRRRDVLLVLVGVFVPVQPCPARAPAALTPGMLGIFGFGALGIYAGARIGGGWAALPHLGWRALFGSLGWNFLEYGLTFDAA